MNILNGRTILLADDERYITSALASKMQKAGARTIIASDGAEALELALQHRPDLIVSDFQMPILSGLDLCRKLKREHATANIPVVMLTARGYRLEPSELSSTNIQAVLSKPFSIREVIETLQNLCAERVV